MKKIIFQRITVSRNLPKHDIFSKQHTLHWLTAKQLCNRSQLCTQLFFNLVTDFFQLFCFVTFFQLRKGSHFSAHRERLRPVTGFMAIEVNALWTQVCLYFVYVFLWKKPLRVHQKNSKH